MNFKKIVLGIGIILGLFIVAAMVLPYFFRDKIKLAVLEAANEQLEARVSLGDADLSILRNLRNFPDISLILSDVTIVGKDSFSADTLLNLPKAKFSLDLMSVIKSGQTMELHTIELYDASINALVLPSGKANWEITKPSKPKTDEKSDFKLSLERIVLENIQIKYSDFNSNQFLAIHKLNHTGKGDFSNATFDYESDLEIEKFNFKKGAIPFLTDANITYEGKVAVDKNLNKYTFQKNEFTLNALKLLLEGSLQQMNDNAIATDLSLVANPAEFKDVLSLIPAIFKNDFKNIESSGKFDIKGTLKGIYKGEIYPKSDFTFNIQNGMFQYPDMPKRISNINISSKITNPGGTADKFVVTIPRFSMNIGADPFSGKLNLSTPISNPTIDLTAKGKINLADVMQFYPMEGVKTLQGLVNLDLDVSAKKSDIDAKNYSAIRASGVANISNLKYESETVGKVVNVSNITLNFSPQYVDMPVCRGTIGKSDFDIAGKLENFLGYYLSPDAVLGGSINFRSNYLDANEFLPSETEVKKAKENKSASSLNEYVMVPANVNFTGQVDIAKMHYGKMDINNLNGKITIANEIVNLQGLNANMLGGNATISGTYSTIGKSFPKTTLNYNINSFDIKQLADNMESAQKLAPILKFMNGTISSKSNITCALLPDFSPDLKTINGDFSIGLPIAKLANVPALNQIAQVTKLSQLNNLEVQNVNMNVSISNGRIITQPLNFVANGMKMGLQGSQGLDKSLDYKLSTDVPLSQLGPAQNVVNNLLSKVNLPFLNQAKPEGVRLNINIGGFFDKPSVTLAAPELLKGDGSASTASNTATQVLDQAKQAVDNLKQEAINRIDSAKKQVQQEAERKVEEVKKKAEDEIIKKKNEALDALRKKLPW